MSSIPTGLKCVLLQEPNMIFCTTPTPEQIKAQQALVASHASAGSFGAIVGFVPR